MAMVAVHPSRVIRASEVQTPFDHDLKVVIQFLSHISPELGSDRTAYGGIVARDSKVNFMLGIEDTDFRLFSRCLSLVGFSLQKVCNRSGFLPERIVERTIHFRDSVDAVCLRGSKGFRNSRLSLICLRTCT